jgi:hypothetical protein
MCCSVADNGIGLRPNMDSVGKPFWRGDHHPLVLSSRHRLVCFWPGAFWRCKAAGDLLQRTRRGQHLRFYAHFPGLIAIIYIFSLYISPVSC